MLQQLLSSIRVKHLRQDMVQSCIPISRLKITWSPAAEGEFLELVTGMVKGAMVSSLSVACKPARLHLKSSKSCLVITVQSTMRTICLIEVGKDLKCSQQILVANSKGFHSAIVILVSESIPCWLHESEDIWNDMDSSSSHGLDMDHP